MSRVSHSDLGNSQESLAAIGIRIQGRTKTLEKFDNVVEQAERFDLVGH